MKKGFVIIVCLILFVTLSSSVVIAPPGAGGSSADDSPEEPPEDSTADSTEDSTEESSDSSSGLLGGALDKAMKTASNVAQAAKDTAKKVVKNAEKDESEDSTDSEQTEDSTDSEQTEDSTDSEQTEDSKAGPLDISDEKLVNKYIDVLMLYDSPPYNQKIDKQEKNSAESDEGIHTNGQYISEEKVDAVRTAYQRGLEWDVNSCRINVEGKIAYDGQPGEGKIRFAPDSGGSSPFTDREKLVQGKFDVTFNDMDCHHEFQTLIIADPDNREAMEWKDIHWDMDIGKSKSFKISYLDGGSNYELRDLKMEKTEVTDYRAGDGELTGTATVYNKGNSGDPLRITPLITDGEGNILAEGRKISSMENPALEEKEISLRIGQRPLRSAARKLGDTECSVAEPGVIKLRMERDRYHPYRTKTWKAGSKEIHLDMIGSGGSKIQKNIKTNTLTSDGLEVTIEFSLGECLEEEKNFQATIEKSGEKVESTSITVAPNSSTTTTMTVPNYSPGDGYTLKWNGNQEELKPFRDSSDEEETQETDDSETGDSSDDGTDDRDTGGSPDEDDGTDETGSDTEEGSEDDDEFRENRDEEDGSKTGNEGDRSEEPTLNLTEEELELFSWKSYCANNQDSIGINTDDGFSSSEAVKCIEPCYGADSDKETPQNPDRTCGDLIEDFCNPYYEYNNSTNRCEVE